ncbi:hypothetical protein KC19_5G134000 [Ceratodon purpureus]|uniref:NAC domain-containing protein n=2 Tax=Ceratodon purpureus TaxID=3225 RepID=A0A8T0I0Z0_CERPU|nr:hypothetical protein KC19_5G134000 [Ceratodon purpureus]
MELDSRQTELDSDQKLVLQTGGLRQLHAHDVTTIPGFRFQPTEEELVGFYLRSMVTGNRPEVDLINVLNLYHYDPWELPAMAFMQSEREWLFFCPRDTKYPNGARPNRVTASGYWKATGTDRPVRRAQDACCIGLKKTLVFYTGRAPRGRKTEWIMNEYRLPQNEQRSTFCQAVRNFHLKTSNTTTTELDMKEVALCRIYKKPFQINFLGATANLVADSFMPDIVDPSGSSAPNQALPSPNRVKFAGHCNGSTLDSDVNAGISKSSTSSTARKTNIVKDQTDLSSNLVSRYKFPGIPDETDDMSAQLIEAEVQRRDFRNSSSSYAPPNLGDKYCALEHMFMQRRNAGAEASTHQVVDRLNWSDCNAGETARLSTPNKQLQVPGDQCPTMASIDRMLKASMWSPRPPANLDCAGALMKLDYGDDINELDIRSLSMPKINSESGQFEWSSLPL